MDHIPLRIGGDRFAGSPDRQMPGGILLPAFVLAPHFGDLDAAMMFMDRAERRARFDRLQLLRIADQHDLRARVGGMGEDRSEEHTSELQSLMRISYAVFCLNKQTTTTRKLSEHRHRSENTTLRNAYQ